MANRNHWRVSVKAHYRRWPRRKKKKVAVPFVRRRIGHRQRHHHNR